MALFDDLCTNLAATAEQLADSGKTRRRRIRRATELAGVMFAAVVAAGAASPLWTPVLGDGTQHAPTLSRTAPLREQLANLGVLRRAPTGADRNPAALSTLRLLDASLTGVRVDSLRALRGADTGAFVVPATTYRSPDGIRTITDPLCLFVADPSGGGGLSCFTTDAVLHGRAILGIGRKLDSLLAHSPLPGNPGQGHFSQVSPRTPAVVRIVGLVPDGVYRVAAPGAGPPSSAKVVDNSFVLDVSRPANRLLKLTWLRADGSVVHH